MMSSRLNQSDPADFVKGEKLTKRLSRLLRRGFTTLDQAIVYAAMHNLATNVKPENFPDLTGFECFVNHIRIEDQLEGFLADKTALLRQGIAFALATESQLHFKFPGRPFNVIVAETSHGCGVRFHLVRRGEEWLADDLDGYREEAILVLSE